jgi:hypothetical protein
MYEKIYLYIREDLSMYEKLSVDMNVVRIDTRAKCCVL